MRLHFVFGTALVLLASAATAQDPTVVGPSNYKQSLDNERVRGLMVTYKPGEEVALHSHPDTVVYIVAGGKMRFTDKDGKATDREARAGETLFIPAGSHSVKNVGRKTVQAFVAELKEPPMAGTLSSSERAEILDLYDRSGNELQALVARTPDELWARKPAPDRWSVSEVVEHLALVENALNGFILQTLAAPADPNWTATETARSIDAILRGGTDRTKKFTSPEFADPKGGKSRAELLASWGGARAQNAELVRRTTAEVKKHTADVPNGGKMTMHQLMAYVAIHNLRHNAQIAEALAQLGAK